MKYFSLALNVAFHCIMRFAQDDLRLHTHNFPSEPAFSSFKCCEKINTLLEISRRSVCFILARIAFNLRAVENWLAGLRAVGVCAGVEERRPTHHAQSMAGGVADRGGGHRGGINFAAHVRAARVAVYPRRTGAVVRRESGRLALFAN